MPKKKGMNRTAGTARRKMSASERVSYALKTGAPLTGSASGVKSISLREAGEALTQGIVTVRGGKLKFAPEGLAMALPFGKVFNAAKALRGAGKIAQATALEARLGAKVAGSLRKGTIDMGRQARKTSESVFPRAPKKGALGDLEAGALPGSNMTNVQARRLAASRAADRAGNYTPVRELEKRLKLPKGRGK